MSINAAPRTTEQSIRRFEATILRLPVKARGLGPAFGASAQAMRPTETGDRRSSLLVPALLAVLLVLCCIAWEALSGRWS